MALIIGEAVKPMLVSESGSSEKKFSEVLRIHKGRTLAEVKYDGYRIQVHKSSDLWFFTRNLNCLATELFPELKQETEKMPQGIFDGELVGMGEGIKGFNSVKKRVRGELNLKLTEEFPLQIRFFDILMLENKPLIEKPFEERRKILEEHFENISEQQEILNDSELSEKFNSVTSQGMEGLVCKNPYSFYHTGKRTKDWIKLKKFLSLDLVVLGIYKGEGKAAELPFAALLLGTKNKSKYETITKVGISDRNMIDSIYKKIKDYLLKKPSNKIILSSELEKKTYAGKVPFYYIEPENSVVVEAEALNVTRSKNWHSCGLKNSEAYSLRIPIVKRIRDDKKAEEATTSKQVAEIYEK